jgi:hypothetical protein
VREAGRALRAEAAVEAQLTRLAPPQEPEGPRSLPRGESAHCTACGRPAAEVQHLMAGGQAVLCDQCVVTIGRRRAELRAPDEARCQVCHRSAFEARGLYSYNGVEVCNHCLELSLGLLEREEVDRFLASW